MPTKIPYCDEVLEVTGGCTKCSSGCQNCWAIKEVWRMAHNPLLGDKWKGLVEKTESGLNWTGKIKLFEDALQIPLKRKKPTMYFIDSKADLFHESVPFEFVDEVMAIIEKCPQHTFQVLTKRPERMAGYIDELTQDTQSRTNIFNFDAVEVDELWPLKNLWLGVSVENQKWLDRYYDFVSYGIPAAKIFVSFEPLLSSVETHFGTTLLRKPDWVIIGCESLPGGRAGRFCEDEDKWWQAARDIKDQVVASGGRFFMKQGPINGKVEHDINKFPKDLQLREYPIEVQK